VVRPLKDEVVEKLPWLFSDLNFKLTYFEYEPRAMGEMVLLESESLRLRFIRERSVVFVELAPPSEPDRWLDLKRLWESLKGERPQPELQGLAWFVRDNLVTLAEALGPNFQKTKLEYERLVEEGRQAAERHLGTRAFDLPKTTWKRVLLQVLPWVLLALIFLWAIFRQ